MNTSPPPESSSRSAAAPTRTTPGTIVIGSTCWAVMTLMIADPQTPRPSCVYYCTLRTLAPAIHHTKVHVKALDARLGALPCQESWSQARASIVSPFRAATYQTLIGLLAASGLRIGEAIKLDRSDIDWDQGVLLIRESKFGKSRLVPLHPSTMQALAEIARLRDELQRRPKEASFFVSLTRKRLSYAVVGQTFRQLVDNAGVGTDAPSPPRLHDLRHTFAIRTLLSWYRSDEDVQAKIPSLSTYLGHREPASTYWYLSAAPELLALAAARQDTAWSAARPGTRS